MNDYVYAMMVERARGMNPTNEKKAESICKTVARQVAQPFIDTIRQCPDNKVRPLPSKSYCRNFFDTLPTTHIWSGIYPDLSKRPQLEQVLQASKDSDSPEKLFASGLELVCCDIGNGNYERSFKTLAGLNVALAQLTSESAVVLALKSLYYELVGTEKHLRCNLSGAIVAYEEALCCKRALKKDDVGFELDVTLKLASIYLEVGDNDKATKTFDSLMSSIENKIATSTDEVADSSATLSGGLSSSSTILSSLTICFETIQNK